MAAKAWWDEVAYSSSDVQPLWSMQVEAPERLPNPIGFVPLRERHRVKAERSVTNEQDRRCRIRKVRLK